MRDIPIQGAGLLVEAIDGELIVLDEGRDIVVHANATAAIVFQLCDGQRTVDEIVALLCAAYPDNETDIRADVPTIIETLIDQRVLEWTQSGEASTP